MTNPVQDRLDMIRELCLTRGKLYYESEVTADRDPALNGIIEGHVRCATCGQSVLKVTSADQAYSFTMELLLDNYTRHFRQVHEEWSPDDAR